MTHRNRLFFVPCLSVAAALLVGCAIEDPFYTQAFPLQAYKYPSEIKAENLKSSVTVLAADAMEGRMTGSVGAKKAADFICERIRRTGLEPGGDAGSFTQEFPYKEVRCRNVIGILPPSGGLDEYVMVGAHYDHIGHGEAGGSLADKSEEGQIHNGADDNASGTSTVLELAEALAPEWQSGQPGGARRGIIFACWSGEEVGIIGSSYFAEHPSRPLDKIVAYFNFDMVGRLRDNKLVVQGAGSSPDWRRWIEKRNIASGFDLVLQDDPYQPTDTTAFYPKGVPVLGFFTGAHENYNKPSDDANTLDYDGMERIASFASNLIADVCSAPTRLAYAKVEMKPATTSTRRGRVTTGTIPDYATSGITGMKLSGVRGGGPADKAGLQAGDIIIQLGDQPIADVQAYSDALGSLQADVPVQVVIVRNGEKKSLSLTPAAAQ